MMKRARPPKDGALYRSVWRLVDGAVRDALQKHPEYFTRTGTTTARYSIVKRVAGAIVGFVEQSTRGRSGAKSAAENATDAVHSRLTRQALLGGSADRETNSRSKGRRRCWRRRPTYRPRGDALAILSGAP